MLANDTDPEGTNLAIDSFTQPGNGTVSFDLTTGRFTYTPDRDFHGSDSFTYTVIDEDGMSSEGTVDITVDSVNDAPVANNDDVMVDEGGTTAVLDVLANDTDVDGSTLQATLVSGPAHGTVTFNADGTFVYEHDGSETTTDEFTYAIDDSQGGTATATVGIAVRPLNDAPEAGQDSYSVDEDSTLLVDSVSGVLTNDSDAEESALTAQLVSATNFGSLTLNPDGSFSYSPNADFHGADGFSYVAVDSENGSSAVQLVEIFVDAVNDAPVPTDDSITVAEGGTTISVNAFANDVDVDGPTLLGSVLVGPNHGTVVFDSDGSFTYEHDGSETTDDHFSYFVKDSAGGEAIGNVNISITAVNDAPIAINDNVTALFTEPRTISVEELTANDLDEEMDEITIVIVQQPLHGVVTVEPDGSITYATNDFTVGTDSFDYVITDGESTSVTPGTVFVELTLPPVPPEFGGGPFTEEATMESTGTAEATTSEPVVGGDSLTIDTDEASEFGADAEDDEEDLVTLPPSYFESEVDALSPTKRDRSSLFVESSANRIGIFEYYRIPVNPSVDSGHDNLNGVSEFLASSTPISNTLLAKALVESIDSIGEDIESDLAKAGIISGSIVLASSSLSVGLVSLGVRLGYVVAGVLTSSPAWRAFDPVLISQILDEDDDDSGTIESLLTS